MPDPSFVVPIEERVGVDDKGELGSIGMNLSFYLINPFLEVKRQNRPGLLKKSF